ncbi:MAG: WbqC family protein [Nitrospirota bacterium]
MCDKFVVFDHVQAMRGKSWFTRNRILLNGNPVWLTMPIEKKGKSIQKISDAKINYSSNFKRKHLGTLRQAYMRTQYFNEVFPVIEELYSKQFQRMSDFNVSFLTNVCAKLGIDTCFAFSSQMEDLSAGGSQLVLDICRKAGANVYISGSGCMDFIEPNSFEREGIKFTFQRFTQPVYKQINNAEFVSHLSVLDALFNVGVNGVKEMIENC